MSRSGSIKKFEFLRKFSKATEKTMFCFVSVLYWTESKKFVDSARQCFAFTPCVQFKPKFKCWQHLAGSWQDSTRAFLNPQDFKESNKSGDGWSLVYLESFEAKQTSKYCYVCALFFYSCLFGNGKKDHHSPQFFQSNLVFFLKPNYFKKHCFS